MDWKRLEERLKEHNQQHLVAHVDSLTDDERLALYTDISDIDLEKVSKLWSQAQMTLAHQQGCQTVEDSKLSPLDRSLVGSSQDITNTPRWWNIGTLLYTMLLSIN